MELVMDPVWIRILYPVALAASGVSLLFGLGTLIHGCSVWYSQGSLPWEIMDAGFSALAAGCASGLVSAGIALTKVR